MAAIKVARNVLLRPAPSFKEMCTHSDSRAAIMATHSGTSGDCKADAFAREGTITPISSDWERIVTPLFSRARALDPWTFCELDKCGSLTRTCAAAGSFCSGVNARSSELLVLINIHLGAIVCSEPETVQ